MDESTNLPSEIATYEDPTEPAVRGPWKVRDLADADWAMLRLAECEEEIAELERQAEAARALIAHRLAVLTERKRKEKEEELDEELAGEPGTSVATAEPAPASVGAAAEGGEEVRTTVDRKR